MAVKSPHLSLAVNGFNRIGNSVKFWGDFTVWVEVLNFKLDIAIF